MSPPRVSVVLPVRDGERFVADAIRSILDQTEADLELLVIENGSTDRTLEVVRDAIGDDPRGVVVEAGPIGLVASLNLGIERSRGAYLARMDADDIAHPRRLETQLAILDADRDCVAVGARYRYVDESGDVLGTRRVPTGSADVAASLHFGNPIVHPSVVFAVERIDPPLRYVHTHPDAEDFELWVRLTRNRRIRNAPDVLLDYRVHPGSVGAVAPDGATSGVDALTAVAPWGSARWIHERTFNAHQRGIGLGPFLVATIRLNAANAVRPMSPRVALARRSVMAVASMARRRWRERSRPGSTGRGDVDR